VVSVLLGVLWFVASIAAPVIGFVVTGVSGSERQGPLPWQQPGAGAALVGWCCFLFVFGVGAQISLVREFRRHPGRRVRPRGSSRAYMIPELLRRNVLISILMIPGIAVGMWLRHRYG
jgi:MFS family permease